jgi:hypothetical protein
MHRTLYTHSGIGSRYILKCCGRRHYGRATIHRHDEGVSQTSDLLQMLRLVDMQRLLHILAAKIRRLTSVSPGGSSGMRLRPMSQMGEYGSSDYLVTLQWLVHGKGGMRLPRLLIELCLVAIRSVKCVRCLWVFKLILTMVMIQATRRIVSNARQYNFINGSQPTLGRFSGDQVGVTASRATQRRREEYGEREERLADPETQRWPGLFVYQHWGTIRARTDTQIIRPACSPTGPEEEALALAIASTSTWSSGHHTMAKTPPRRQG